MAITPLNEHALDQGLAKAFSHPLRARIMMTLHERVASPSELAREVGRELNLVAYHVKVLERCGCIEMVEARQRRGATEHFYRATRRHFLDDEQWAELPGQLRSELAETLVRAMLDDLAEAVEEGSFEEMPDLHLSRTPMAVDRQGWDEVVAILSEALDRVLAVQERASRRLAGANGDGTALFSRVLMLHFTSPSRGDRHAD
jgi:DNA-binding transcriptional ArsR family regulator